MQKEKWHPSKSLILHLTQRNAIIFMAVDHIIYKYSHTAHIWQPNEKINRFFKSIRNSESRECNDILITSAL